MSGVIKKYIIMKNSNDCSTRWKTNQYTCGSYSFIPVGASAEDIEMLAEPVNNAFEKVGLTSF